MLIAYRLLLYSLLFQFLTQRKQLHLYDIYIFIPFFIKRIAFIIKISAQNNKIFQFVYRTQSILDKSIEIFV